MLRTFSTFWEAFGEVRAHLLDVPEKDDEGEDIDDEIDDVDWSWSDDEKEKDHELAVVPASASASASAASASASAASASASASAASAASASAGTRLLLTKPGSIVSIVGTTFDSREDALRGAREAHPGKSLVQVPGSNNASIRLRCRDAVDVTATKEARAGAKRGSYQAQKIVWKSKGCPGGSSLTRERKCADVHNPWTLVKVTPHVNCGGQQNLTAKELAALCERKVRQNRGISASDLLSHVAEDRPNVVVPARRTIMNAKHIVLDLLDEAYDDSFSAFKRWGRLATEATPGATFDMNVLPATSTFDSAFFAVPADSLADAVLPVGALDGAHSKHRYYKGVYLTLTVMTPEGTILLLAWACVPSESTASWTWFLRNCARAGLTRFFANKVIFSDRDKGLAAALAAVFPDAFSFWCAWHLLQNLYKVVKGNRACLGHRAFLFWAVVKAVTRDDYDEAMQNLRASSHAAHAYLAKLDICRYSVFAANEAGVALHGRVTSQFAESINAAMSKTCKSARFLPPLGFFQEAHVRVVNQLAEFHRRVSADTTSILLDRATTLLEKSLQDAAHLKVTWSSPTTALVVDDVQTVTVRMPVDDDIVTSLECACGIYSQYGVPCPHQVAAAKHRGKGFDYADFATLHVKAYHQRINAVAAVSTCIVCAPSIDGDVLGLKPDEADGKITPPPRRDLKKKKGPSSKHKRMKGAMELNDKKGKGKQHA